MSELTVEYKFKGKEIKVVPDCDTKGYSQIFYNSGNEKTVSISFSKFSSYLSFNFKDVNQIKEYFNEVFKEIEALENAIKEIEKPKKGWFR